MRRAIVSGVVLLAVALLLAACSGGEPPPRKQQRIVLLPAAPPPPPPPPKPEERPPPRPLDKPLAQDLPKPAEAPQPQALKTDEAAGNGPGNGLAAGAVTQDYNGQPTGAGTALGGSGATDGAARLAATVYGNATTRALNEFLVRDKSIKLSDYKVRVALWLGSQGRLRRVELLDSTGDPQTDASLREALNRFPGTQTPPPPGLPQPMRVLVSNRLMG